MLIKYFEAALHQAHYDFLKNDKTFYGEIPKCKGVYATGKTLEECRDQLAEVLEEWLLFRVSKNLEIPSLNGYRLKVKETM